jgi:hypothetical protein
MLPGGFPFSQLFHVTERNLLACACTEIYALT